MLVVGDALDAIYLGCFLFGLLLSAVSRVGGLAHVGGHATGPPAAIGRRPSRAAAAHLPGKAAIVELPHSPSPIAFVSRFGGIDFPVRIRFGLVTPVSLVCGVAGGVAWFFDHVVAPNDLGHDAAGPARPGVVAHVSTPIRAGGTGAVVGGLWGVRQVSAAPADGAAAYPPGTSARIVRTGPGIACVGSSFGPSPS